jgi:very-short-patch-repair endonuclease
MSGFTKSFSAHPKSVFWHKTFNGSLTPRNCALYSNKKIWFTTCEKGHEFETMLNDAAGGHFCSSCVHKTEQNLYEMLVKDFPSVKREFKPNWSKNRRYDFVIPDFDVIIELDGPQHFEQVANWRSPELQSTSTIQKASVYQREKINFEIKRIQKELQAWDNVLLNKED